MGGNGIVSGLTHPLIGIDHLLAMVAVGIISTQIKARTIWIVPAAFICFMLVGGILAMSVGIPFIEIGIALSVLVLGIAIAMAQKFSLGIVIACVAFFGLFHGHAHGGEMPLIAHPALYASGFVLSTIFLHFMGVLLGLYARRTNLMLRMLRLSGAAISMAGVFFLL